MRKSVRAVVLGAVAAVLLGSAPAAAAPPPGVGGPGFGFSQHRVCDASVAGFARCHANVVDGGPTSPNALTPTGLSPATIKDVYGFSTSATAGAGQTIAIVDAYDAPNIEADLAKFSTQYGLPQCTTGNDGCFKKVNQTGGTSYPRVNAGWALEISLDVQWAHAIAPGAKILLVEAKSNSFANLLAAEDYAAANANYVSNSWGGNEFSSQSAYDSHFSRSGVSFFASSGDAGLPAEYPSASPNVISVGGTTLHFSNGNFTSETGWSSGGGGCSLYANATSAQANFAGYSQVNCNGKRATPDVSLDADPASGVSVYDSTSYNGSSGWFTVGGTSASSPMWAARSAVAGVVVNSAYVYGNAITYRDITSGNNGAPCLAGFDLCTGRGSWTGSSSGSGPASTSTAVVSSQNPSTVGQSVTFTATVSTGTGTATGTVQFKDGANNLGSPQTLNGSAQASLSTSALSQGSHTITAVYGGDGTHSGSTSPGITQTVNSTISTAVIAPSNGATLSGNAMLNGYALPNGVVTKVEYRLSGGPLGDSNTLLGNAAATIYGWIYTWNTTGVPDGSYTLRSRAYDSTNAFVDSAGISITVDNISTNVVIPSNNATVTGNTTLDAGASAAAIRVDYLISGGPFTKAFIGSATNTIYGWLFTWNTASVPAGITPGSYTIYSRAYINATAFDDSAPINVTVT
jgi:Bacterial Ig-like domain (group 3)/Bacterial Ig domain